MSADEGWTVFTPDAQQARILAAAKKVLVTEGVNCPVEIALNGEDVQLNGVPAAEASPEIMEQVLEAGRRADDIIREDEAGRYVDPARNPMIRLPE